MRRLVIGAAILCFLAPVALAQATDPPSAAEAARAQGRRVTDPQWVRRPSASDLLAVFPVVAYRRGEGGRATIICTVTPRGPLRDCRVEQETPAGYGFGAAALALAPQFLMRPGTIDGQPYESEVRMQITFQGRGAALGSYLPRSPLNSAPPMEMIVTRPAWVMAPTFADVLAAYPVRGRSAGVSGRATLSCRITDGGGLDRCNVITEEPRGMGFGAAARVLSGRFRIATVGGDGELLNGRRVHLAVSFPAEALTGSPPAIGRPRWARRPDSVIPGAEFPQRAITAGVTEGQVVLTCVVQVGGGLGDCQVTSETPGGHGFGEAGLALSQGFVMTQWTEDGLPTVGASVRVPLTYRAPSAEQRAPSPPAAAPASGG